MDEGPESWAPDGVMRGYRIVPRRAGPGWRDLSPAERTRWILAEREFGHLILGERMLQARLFGDGLPTDLSPDQNPYRVQLARLASAFYLARRRM